MRKKLFIVALLFIINIFNTQNISAQPRMKFEFSNKDKALAHYNIGINFAKRQLYDKALKEFTLASTLDPDNPDIYYNIGVTYAKLGDYQKAIESYQKVVKLKPTDAFTFYNLAVAQSTVKEIDKAEANYLNAVRYKDNFVEAYANLAMIYLYKKQKNNYLNMLNKIDTLDAKTAAEVREAGKDSGYLE